MYLFFSLHVGICSPLQAGNSQKMLVSYVFPTQLPLPNIHSLSMLDLKAIFRKTVTLCQIHHGDTVHWIFNGFRKSIIQNQ